MADTVYLAGQVAEKAAGGPAGPQMAEILDKIDGLLAEAGSDKSKILSATIWLADMRDFDTINEAWDSWVPEGNGPRRVPAWKPRLAFTKFNRRGRGHRRALGPATRRFICFAGRCAAPVAYHIL